MAVESPAGGVAGRAVIPAGIIAIAALAIALRIGLALATHSTQEDFLITLRYAQNIAHGHGFVYNAGDRVLGTTTPLYSLLLAAAAWLGLPSAAVGKALNIVADGAMCVVVYRSLSLVKQELAGYIAAFLIAVNPISMQVSICGQESCLAALCGAITWLMFYQRRYFAAFIAGAILFLLRWDGLLPIVVLTFATAVRERRIPWPELGVFAAICAPWLAFAKLYFGGLVPVTLAAKTVVYGWYWQSSRFPQLGRLLARLWSTPLYASMLAAVAIGAVRLFRFWTPWSPRNGIPRLTSGDSPPGTEEIGDRLGANVTSPKDTPGLFGIQWMFIPPLIWFAIYWVAFIFSKVWLFEWYLVPPLFVYVMLAALGLSTLAERLVPKWPVAPRTALAATLAIALCAVNVRGAYAYAHGAQELEDHLRAPLGRWLAANARPTDSVMLEPIGYIGYYSKLRVIDMTGLVTPSVLSFYAKTNPCPWLSIANADHPDWCVLRPYEVDLLERTARAQGEDWSEIYEPVETFTYRDPADAVVTAFEVYRRKPLSLRRILRARPRI